MSCLQQFGRKFDDWQQVKQEAHDEEERRLHAKIVLQRELIHAQDEYTHEKQRERESEAIKVGNGNIIGSWKNA